MFWSSLAGYRRLFPNRNRTCEILSPIKTCPVHVLANVIQCVPAKRAFLQRSLRLTLNLVFNLSLFQADDFRRIRKLPMRPIYAAALGFSQPNF